MTLLELHPNLYLCFGAGFSVHAGYQYLSCQFGPDRWVWGTGYPDREGGAAVTALTYSGMPPGEIQAAGFHNIARLLDEVK